MSDLAGFAKALATETKELVSLRLEKAIGGIRESLAGFSGRLDALEQRMGTIRHGEKGEKGDAGRDGRDGETPDVAVIAQRAADLIPRPRDGRDVDPIALKGAIATDLAVMVREEVARHFATIQIPKDGRDGKDADVALIKTVVSAMVADLPVERKSVASDVDVAGIVRETVSAAFAALPTPKDGRDGSSVTVEDVAPLVAREVDRAAKAIEPARDGVGVKGLLINREGHLIATLTDGSTMDAGPVVGRDGKDADPDLMLKMITDAVADIPRPADGKDGQDGADGLGIDDAEILFDERSGFALRLSNQHKTKDLALPLPYYAGTFRMGEKYLKGAIVNCKGVWIAMAETREKPGDGATAWRLIAKNGRDGRDRGGEGNT